MRHAQILRVMRGIGAARDKDFAGLELGPVRTLIFEEGNDAHTRGGIGANVAKYGAGRLPRAEDDSGHSPPRFVGTEVPSGRAAEDHENDSGGPRKTNAGGKGSCFGTP